jgi:hypothetical protein
MANRTQSPFEGKPTTRKFTNSKSQTCYRVTIEAMTPMRTRLADWLSGVAAIGALVGGIKIITMLPELEGWMVAGLLASPLPSYFIAKVGLNEAMRKTVRVEFTPDEFLVYGLFGIKRFDRHIPHKFALYVHDRAEREENVLSYRESKRQRYWWAWKLKRYCGQSYHLSFDYLDQRNVVMTIFKRRTAHNILARLNAVKQVMDNEVNNGAGQALTPEQDWSPQAGALEANFDAGTI